MADPYGSNQDVWVIPAISPDYAVIHVNEATEQGDARVLGTSHWDRIITRSAKRVLVITEKICSEDCFRQQPELTLIPHFMVEAIAVVPSGAWPGSCWPYYEVDYPAVDRYLQGQRDNLSNHLSEAPECRS